MTKSKRISNLEILNLAYNIKQNFFFLFFKMNCTILKLRISILCLRMKMIHHDFCILKSESLTINGLSRQRFQSNAMPICAFTHCQILTRFLTDRPIQIIMSLIKTFFFIDNRIKIPCHWVLFFERTSFSSCFYSS